MEGPAGDGRIRRVYRTRNDDESVKRVAMRDNVDEDGVVWNRVTIGFYAPNEEEKRGWWDSTLHWAVGRWTSRKGRNYSHAELRFSDLYSTSICQADNAVHLMDGKTMGNPRYSAFLTLPVTEEEEYTMRRVAENYHENGVKFNTKGMMCNFMPFFSACMYDTGQDAQNVQQSVFCSQYIVLLFQAAGYLKDLDAASTSPADLYFALCAAGARGDLNRVVRDKRKNSSKTRAPLDMTRALKQKGPLGRGGKKSARHGYKM